METLGIIASNLKAINYFKGRMNKKDHDHLRELLLLNNVCHRADFELAVEQLKKIEDLED